MVYFNPAICGTGLAIWRALKKPSFFVIAIPQIAGQAPHFFAGEAISSLI